MPDELKVPETRKTRQRFRLPYKLIGTGAGVALLGGVALGRMTARAQE